MRLALLASFVLLVVASAAAAQQPAEIVLRDGLAIGGVSRSGRSPVHTDAIEALIVAGKWTAPKAGDTVALPNGTTRTWTAVTADKDGWFSGPALQGGYVFASVDSPDARTMVLDAAGDGLVYVNGEIRTGDPYAAGYVRLPVALKAGRNEFLFQVGRGRLKARLVAPKSAALLDTGDLTTPDLLAGQRVSTWAAIVVLNASPEPLRDATLTSGLRGGRATITPVPVIPPYGVRKVGFRIEGPGPQSTGTAKVTVRLRTVLPDRRRVEADSATFDLRIRWRTETQKRTFISGIDNSVQYFGLNPAKALPHPAGPPALTITLHGAGVEAIGQADAYEAKTWTHLVAPTNRRPFGFDWEEWGRLDALEVLEAARNTLRTDPRRVYLTGHSMGGHGTWIVGATYPDRFAAIGPSAGWISFTSYAGGPRFGSPTPVEAILRRAASPSDTLSLLGNYAQEGVYILHGDADDNVPVTEARTMREKLTAAGIPFAWHEQPGAGHWWDASDEPGTDCVDWAPMFDLFAHRSLPADEDLRRVAFTTASPGVSARCHWLTIEAQAREMEPSSIDIRWDPGQRRFVGTTSNVARLSFSVEHVLPGAPVRVELDGGKIENIGWPSGEPRIWLARDAAGWRLMGKPAPGLKGPERYGPFKEAFNHRPVLVYGTHGSAEENAWALAKARYDGETWWVRGNGSVDVIPDTAFDARLYRERSVMLYGNAETNGAWQALLGTSPVQVRRGVVRIGTRDVTGEDLACLFVRPRPDEARALVGVVSGTGLAGMRLADRLPIFVSGVGYPDCTVFGPESLQQGTTGVRAAGFFGMDWGVETGDFAWGKP